MLEQHVARIAERRVHPLGVDGRVKPSAPVALRVARQLRYSVPPGASSSTSRATAAPTSDSGKCMITVSHNTLRNAPDGAPASAGSSACSKRSAGWLRRASAISDALPS